MAVGFKPAGDGTAVFTVGTQTVQLGCHAPRGVYAQPTRATSTLTFPDNVQGVITSRIDRLTPQQQLTLKVASVIGRVFAFHILRDIYPLQAEPASLATDLATLQQLDITPLDRPPPDLAYVFKHIITREYAYHGSTLLSAVAPLSDPPVKSVITWKKR